MSIEQSQNAYAAYVKLMHDADECRRLFMMAGEPLPKRLAAFVGTGADGVRQEEAGGE